MAQHLNVKVAGPSSLHKGGRGSIKTKHYFAHTDTHTHKKPREITALKSKKRPKSRPLEVAAFAPPTGAMCTSAGKEWTHTSLYCLYYTQTEVEDKFGGV